MQTGSQGKYHLKMSGVFILENLDKFLGSEYQRCIELPGA